MLIKTQRQLRQAISDAKKIITDKQLFLSESYGAFLDAMIAGITKRYQQPVIIELSLEADGTGAYTDGNRIHINLQAEQIRKWERKEKHKAVIASVLHECGHILFTDFRLIEVSLKKLEKENMLYPVPKSSELSEQVGIWLIQNNAGSMLLSLYHQLDNCVEDGYVDNRIIQHIPGYGECRVWYKRELAKEIPSYEEMRKDEKYSNTNIILNLVLSYAKFGVILYEQSSANEELIQKIYEVKLLIDEAVKENNSVERKRIVNEIFIHLFSIIKEEVDKKQKEQSNDTSQSASDASNSVQNANDNKDSQNGKNPAECGNNKEFSKDDVEKLQQAFSYAMHTMPSALSREDNVHKNTQLLMSPSLESKKEDGSSQNDNCSSASSDAGDQGLRQLIESAAREKVAEEQEKELKKELSEQLSEVRENNSLHKTVSSVLNRQKVTDSGIASYRLFHEELDAIAKRLTKTLEKEIRNRKIGDTLNGLYMGKRLDNRNLYREDKKLFTKKIQPENIPDMEVSLLIDLSGSMSGERIKRATETAYVMYQFCKNLHIPVSVYGHHVTGGYVEVVSYTDGISLDNKDGIRIFEMCASGCNRDGYALRFCLEKLKKSEAQTRLMFVVSDGKPNDTNYHLEEGKRDIQDAVAAARKNGILTVTAAIGDDTDTVKKIYTEGVSQKRSAMFLDITKLEQLPKTFPKIIKKYLY